MRLPKRAKIVTLLAPAVAVGAVSVPGTAVANTHWGDCDVLEDATTATATLAGDCRTTRGIVVPDGWTFDGGGHVMTIADPEGASFTGAAIANGGPMMHVRNVRVTSDGLRTACHAGDARLTGIRFVEASGSVTDAVIDGITQGSGCQEGNAIAATAYTGPAQTVVVSDVTVTTYQKTGVLASGGSVHLEMTGSRIGSAGAADGGDLDETLASNSVQVSYGASAKVTGTEITGNDWDRDTNWVGTAVLLYQSGDVAIRGVKIVGEGTDIGVYAYKTGTVDLAGSSVTRTADDSDVDAYGVGLYAYDSDTRAAGVKFAGWLQDLDGNVEIDVRGNPSPQR